MNGDAQANILAHLRTSVFNIEDAQIDYNLGEFLELGATEKGDLEIRVNIDGVVYSDLVTKWSNHKDGCSDCTGWSL